VTATELILRVNGKDRHLAVEARTTLADALRDHLDLPGTHLGCEHGVCGACTVLLDGAPARACLLFALACKDSDITTIEGLAEGQELHPMQRAFVENFGLQCGFCTSGFIMLAVGAIALYPELDDPELTEVLSSNLCRCTGYRSIVAAVKQAAAEMSGGEGRRAAQSDGSTANGSGPGSRPSATDAGRPA
jgi:aerobic carbon-monoxide dehydrogenase small subunit